MGKDSTFPMGAGTTTEALERNFDLARSEQISLSDATTNAVAEMQNPRYTVAVAGCFQVGKSTLLNKAFLGEDVLLRQGDGRCTTAVMTKVVYGPEKKLTVFYRDEKREPKVYSADEINDELIAGLTAVDDPDENERQQKRSALANEVKYVQLEYPCDELRQYWFYDTPGVDDPNQELIDLTTLQFLSDSDLVILVVDASKQFDETTKQFLARSVFQEGLGRVLILASYRPELNYRSAQEREGILQTMRAELAQMGRGYVPVLGYTFDPNVDGEILRGSTEIRSAILEYIEANKRVVRDERLAWLLRLDFLREIERIQAILLTNAQNETEREELRKKIERIVKDLDAEYNGALNNLRMKFLQIAKWLGDEIDARLLNLEDPNSALSLFLKRFDNCGSLADVRAEIEPATNFIKTEIDYAFAEVGEDAQKKVADVLSETSQEAAQAARNVKISTEWETELNPGLAGKIHPTIVRVAEVAIGFGFFNVLGAVAALFANKIPLVQKVLPSVWLKSSVVNALKKSFVEAIEAAKLNVLTQFENSRTAIETGVKELYQDIYFAKVKPYEDQLENDAASLSQDELDALRARADRCARAVDELTLD